jgi:hypothetical protein
MKHDGIENEDADLFGHVGFLAMGDAHTRWAPVSWASASLLRQDIANGCGVSKWLTVQTMNNRLISVRRDQMKRIWIVDDGSDGPVNDFQWHTTMDDYAGISPELYRAMAEWADGDTLERTSPAVRKAALAHIEHAGFSDRPSELRALLRHTVVHFTDGTTTSYEADRQDLTDFVEALDDPDMDIVRIAASEDEFESFYPISMLRMIDIPLLELEAAGVDADDA